MTHAILTLLVTVSVFAGTIAAQSPARRDPGVIRLHPGAFAQMVDELGGLQVSLVRAKVVSVLSPRALLIESAGALEPAPGFLNRVLVLVEGGTIRVPPRLLVGHTLDITGVARTVLGVQVSREVAWPPELTDDVVRRYEIAAAIVTSSVRTPDGVQLVTASVEDAGAPGAGR